MTTGGDPRDRLDAVVRSARRLATAGVAALPEVVETLAGALSVEAAVVLREVGAGRVAESAVPGAVLAAVHPSAVPQMRSADSPAVVSLPVRVGGEPACFLTVVAREDLTGADIALVEAHADLVALALAADRRRTEVVGHVLDEEAARAEVAAALHEGPVSSLVAARYALDTGSEPAAARAVVQQALRELRGIVASQRPRGIDGDLARALRGLAADLREPGRTVELSIAGVPPGSVAPACAVAAYRIVAAALDGASGRPVVTVTGDPEGLTVTVTGAVDPHDAGALDRWARRVRALEGTLERHPDGVTVYLPSRLPAVRSTGALR